jgi:NADH:ubiquinone oxidoreductase subunit F (NADH-binding)/NADH:ubiquinone oxidoreductase subunit E
VRPMSPMNPVNPVNPIQELLAVQHEAGYLSRDSLVRISRRLGVPRHRLQELVSYYPHLRTTPPPDVTVEICRDVACYLNGAETLAARLADAVADAGGDASRLEVHEVSCLGYCDLAPAALVNGVPVRLDDVEELVAGLVQGLEPGRELELPQVASAPSRRWDADPYDDPGERYGAIRKLVRAWNQSSSRDGIIAELREAGLRGMGGAGFPTGRKWELVRAAEGEPKFVICNADESEPGTFKDRVILEQLPHLVIEGMVMDAFTVGASQGYVYLRHEYAAAKEGLERELALARRVGALGDNIFGSGVDFDIEVFVSPGGYILGEETALLEALEGKRGEPRNKPPFPGQEGLWGKPTLINNVETLAMAPAIGLKGAAWWRDQGRGEVSGLKFVAVSGQVARPGVYQIALGTPVSELLALAGGVSGGRALKGFAPGGASSKWLPASAVDTPFDFGSLDEAGSMMGSGALVVVAEPTPMAPVVLNLVRFFRNESCGKCVPCRVGCEKAVVLLERSLATGEVLDRAVVDRLQRVLSEASICGLGHVALNPLLSAAGLWPDELPMTNPNARGAR